jgi:hypothetical protein
MDTPTIVALVLGSLGSLTGIASIIELLWGPGILARREKVIVTEPSLYFHLVLDRDALPLPKSKRVANLKIDAGFNLVRTGGTKDIYVVKAYFTLNRHLHRELMRYFPPNVPILDFEIYEPQRLEFNRPRPFKLSLELAGTELGAALLESPQQKADFDRIATNMEGEFQIHWEYADGRKDYHHYPAKWWHKIVPKRFWRW